MNISAAQKANFDKHLKSLTRYNDKVMDMASFLLVLVMEGRTGQVAERPKYEYNRRKFNNMSSRQEREEYEEKLKEMITDYRAVHPTGNFISLTRTEYEYFLQLIDQHQPEAQEPEFIHEGVRYGRGWFNLEPGQQISSMDQMQVGDLVLCYSKAFHANNTRKIINRRDIPVLRYDLVYWDPIRNCQAGPEVISIAEYQLQPPFTDYFYMPAMETDKIEKGATRPAAQYNLF